MERTAVDSKLFKPLDPYSLLQPASPQLTYWYIYMCVSLYVYILYNI